MRNPSNIMHIIQPNSNMMQNPQNPGIIERLDQILGDFPLVAVLGKYIMISLIFEMADKLHNIPMLE